MPPPQPHPPRADLALSFSPLFGPLQKDLAHKRFAVDTDVEQSVTSWLQTLDIRLSYPGIIDWVPQWNTCLYVSGEYLGLWCVPSATTVPCIHQNQTIFPCLILLDTFLQVRLSKQADSIRQ